MPNVSKFLQKHVFDIKATEIQPTLHSADTQVRKRAHSSRTKRPAANLLKQRSLCLQCFLTRAALSMPDKRRPKWTGTYPSTACQKSSE